MASIECICKYCEQDVYAGPHKAWCPGAGRFRDIDQAQAWFETRLRMPGGHDLHYCCEKLVIEAAEALDKIMKVARDKLGGTSDPHVIVNYFRGNPKEAKALLIECSDAQWYILRIAAILDMTGSEFLRLQADKIIDRQARGADAGSGDNR